jgi:hypothetical protein
MKLEFLPSGSRDCPLLRLYAFDRVHATQFRDLCLELAGGKRQLLSMPDDFSVTPISGCRLTLKSADTNKGIHRLSSSTFECVLKPSDWDTIAELVEPFCQSDRAGYQWLVETGQISLLFSRDGTW